jgi:hypothetical protein
MVLKTMRKRGLLEQVVAAQGPRRKKRMALPSILHIVGVSSSCCSMLFTKMDSAKSRLEVICIGLPLLFITKTLNGLLKTSFTGTDTPW